MRGFSRGSFGQTLKLDDSRPIGQSLPDKPREMAHRSAFIIKAEGTMLTSYLLVDSLEFTEYYFDLLAEWSFTISPVL